MGAAGAALLIGLFLVSGSVRLEEDQQRVVAIRYPLCEGGTVFLILGLKGDRIDRGP